MILYFIAIFVLGAVLVGFAEHRILKAAGGGPFRNKQVIITIRRWERIILLASFIAFMSPALILAVIYTAIFQKFDRIISHPLFMVPALCFGFAVYRMRGSRPFMFGIAELWVAIIAIFLSITTPNQGILTKLLGITGGLFIMVRGMDNMDKGLPPRFRRRWDILFPKHRS